jgi:hypothetical protein
MTMSAPPLQLTSSRTQIDLDERGKFIAVRDTASGVNLIGEPDLAECWRLLVPIPELRSHYLRSGEQDPPIVTATAKRVVFRWESLQSAVCGKLPITITLTVAAADGGVDVSCSIDNRSEHVVEEVLYPAVGGLAADDPQSRWRFHHVDEFGKGHEWPFFAEFPGTYLGPEHPVWVLPYSLVSALPYVDIYHADTGVGFYVGRHDPEARLAAAFLQLRPGTVWRGDVQAWPTRSEVTEPIGLTLGWSAFPFLPPGERTELASVHVAVHSAGWRGAAQLFRRWWDEHFTVAEPSWLSEEDAWQSTILAYPDGKVGYRYADLPRLAKAARRYGINVVHLCGWHAGGIDRNYPFYETSEALGSHDDLAQAIIEIQRLGMRVLVFGNLQVANLETEWFAEAGHAAAARDPRGHPYNTVGWDYNTTTGMLGLSGYRMHWMNPSHPTFHKVWGSQVEAMLALSGDGIQIDKMLGGGALDYGACDGDIDASVPRGCLTAIDELLSAGRERTPGFALASESHWDRMVSRASAAYARFFSGDHLPVLATVFPEYKQTCCVTGPADYFLVNNCLRYGHIISLEPRYMHGDADDVPDLASYVRDVLRLRRQLRHVLWNSRLADPADWTVSEPDVYLGAHKAINADAAALVLHHAAQHPRTVTVDRAAGDAARATLHEPGRDPRTVMLPAQITIDAHRAAVLVLDHQLRGTNTTGPTTPNNSRTSARRNS